MAKILAVDDAQTMRAVVKSVLENEGHQVTSAEDGRQALAIAKDKPVDLVITDLHMPNMDGTRLVHQLRLLDHYKGTPILMLTTEGSEELKKKARNLGASGWLKKPFDPPRLLKAVGKLLGETASA